MLLLLLISRHTCLMQFELLMPTILCPTCHHTSHSSQRRPIITSQERYDMHSLYSTITIPFLQIAGAPGFYASLDSNTSFFSFLQVWIHNIGLGSLVYNVEKICDDSGEDPTCSRSSISLKWKSTADSRCIFIISFPLHFQLFGVFHTHLYSGR